MTHVLSTKVNTYLQTIQIEDREHGKALFDCAIKKLRKLLESECYMEIPVGWLNTKEFAFTIDKMPVDTLQSFGLENNMKFPNFSAVRSLLNKRFSFNSDDNQENNPLKTI
jgi:hypothetical protein